ncbi:MAG: C39 family peptidase [Methanobacteriaceae archaeon]|jgi:predicted double-glycine peptidase
MRKYIAVLLVALIIGVTPAAAMKYGEMTQTVDMTVRGRGADVAAASEVVVSGNNETLAANVSGTNTTMSDDPAPAEATGVDTQIYDTTESVDMQLLDLNDSLDNYTVNVTVPQIDTSGIVMQTTDYSCGPAALATVLQNMGINSTEGELKVLAGTNNETGTSLYSLVRAAQSKGLSAVGMRLSVDDLRTNHIVHVIVDGEGHYSVIRKISNESVYLADPSKGNIVLSREEFSAIFTENVLVINGSLNQTAEQTNSSAQNLTSEEQAISTDTVSVQPENSQTLTTEMMQDIREKKGIKWKWWIDRMARWVKVPRVIRDTMEGPMVA